jgi:hypothetical protein
MAIHNRHDFHAFSALRWSDFRPATFGHNERSIDEAFFFIQRAAFTKLVGNVRQNRTQTPSLKASMHSFVFLIALRQHVPLRTCVEIHSASFQQGQDLPQNGNIQILIFAAFSALGRVLELGKHPKRVLCAAPQQLSTSFI